MPKTLAFDVYGTLIDTSAVAVTLEALVGNKAQAFSKTWREKQLEYSFRKGLMKKYQAFSICTAQALDYTTAYHKTPLSKEQKLQLLESYKRLPAFEDVHSCLQGLQAKGFKLFAFSNGAADAVENLLKIAKIRKFFTGVVSTEDLKTFKPNPAVYGHFLKVAETTAKNAWLISSNPFDIIGAAEFGMSTAWVQRSQNELFDPWGIEPTVTLQSLGEVFEKITGSSSISARLKP